MPGRVVRTQRNQNRVSSLQSHTGQPKVTQWAQLGRRREPGPIQLRGVKEKAGAWWAAVGTSWSPRAPPILANAIHLLISCY